MLLPLIDAGVLRMPRDMINIRDARGWRSEMEAGGYRGVVVGTSDSESGREVESATRSGAALARLPVIAFEDFPGNFRHQDDAGETTLVVESEQAGRIAKDRLGGNCPRMLVFPPVRYDSQRTRLRELRERTRAAWACMALSPPPVLWAGQPETGECLRTLDALLPALRGEGAVLLFKAHPRDRGYPSAYAHLFDKPDGRVRDVTSLDVDAVMALGPRLVVTQFSSVAVEAGFHGVPAMNVLLPEAGGSLLLTKKGYRIPPWCSAGAAYVAVEEPGMPAMLHEALRDDLGRERIISRFDRYFSASSVVLPRLVRMLEDFPTMGGMATVTAVSGDSDNAQAR
ncbi:MAG: hypothetical protein OHM77_10540 [Candidatus Nitricoxidivorans perseverans]|uniref:Uncharacterized protein n=1 Tax=Candidatus Nitricoxidivorans perseverans TaxID=2975601 RepID=A0AA49IXX6_9PROT|nr:MAG: hypothetical protein OHM77_10540 [Candidatus Nitricoxidivorans perseverans]